MGNICYSLKGASSTYCNFMAHTRVGAAVEIRLDDCMLDDRQLKDLFSMERRSLLIATYHTAGSGQTEEAAGKLTTAILAGADYVDIPADWPGNTRRWLINLALNKNCRIIISYHNYKATDPLEQLAAVARDAFLQGADIVKVVTTAKTKEDGDNVLKLYDIFPADKLVAFAMGEDGYNSRLKSFSKGAPLFYLSPSRNKKSAPGQPVYFDFVEEDQIVLRGTPPLPASKSFAQRAILLAALADGTTKLYGITLCSDTRAAIGVAESLGAEVMLEENTLTIKAHQNIARDGLVVKDNYFFVGESALLARLCIPLAGLSREDITITGEKTLLRRKVNDHRAALRKLGLTVDYTDKDYLPATVHGTLKGGQVSISGKKGSQMISGLLLALSQCHEESTLEITDETSAPYICLTEYVASLFGLTDYEMPAEEDVVEGVDVVFVGPDQTVEPVFGLEVEKDWSAAAMLLVAGAIMGDITLKGLDLYSSQADSMIYMLMEECLVDIETKPDVVNVRKSIISPFSFDVTDTPDLFAALFLLATQAEGESVLYGIKRLKNKESDRAVAFSEEFAKLGVSSRIVGDELYINGHENFIYHGAKCSAHGDHRLAMALYIASLYARGEVEVEGMESVDKSFPNFVETINRLKTK